MYECLVLLENGLTLRTVASRFDEEIKLFARKA